MHYHQQNLLLLQVNGDANKYQIWKDQLALQMIKMVSEVI
jgi:hypothetical protein